MKRVAKKNKSIKLLFIKNAKLIHWSVCEICQAAEETTAHIIFWCSHARGFWATVRIQTQPDWPIQAIKEIQPPSHIPAKHLTTFVLLCCWHICKRRNNTVVFRSGRMTLGFTLAACKTEACIWGARLPRDDKTSQQPGVL